MARAVPNKARRATTAATTSVAKAASWALRPRPRPTRPPLPPPPPTTPSAIRQSTPDRVAYVALTSRCSVTPRRHCRHAAATTLYPTV